MKIKNLRMFHLSVPLKKPFKTALRAVDSAEDTVVIIEGEKGLLGFGEAPPTAVITGDINPGIRGIIREKIAPKLIGEEIENLEKLLHIVDRAAVGNSSAKAAVDIALYDLFAHRYNIPLFRLLGGNGSQIMTDLTVSVNKADEMAEDAVKAVKEGYKTLKIKVGKGRDKDLERVKAVREAVGPDIAIRLDANQGWEAKEAVGLIKEMEELGLNLELVEQPVPAGDLEGLKFVTENVMTKIMADESLFSPANAFLLLKMKACDLLNIKLMKSGGIYNADQINSTAEAWGVECMVGSMLESKISVTAAAHLGAAHKNITRFDLDAPSLLAEDPVQGGIEIDGPIIRLPEKPGLGIDDIAGLKEV
ncbi:o-succinylbenzoate synthase [Halanaerobium sp. DL-01]|uniref:mandelate racemase/muconate lactonizing enzyme family protein n=1 Tax=Halanaerobium sp. DL-01 TaxID=1653064 RepID=UPI000DF3402B|nr:dipeptide epimerase [Halanaerobium sp. DL-01]RCW81086.1 o-succinylbenzoate synthase [Halanaerobium sp. DL-01]